MFLLDGKDGRWIRAKPTVSVKQLELRFFGHPHRMAFRMTSLVLCQTAFCGRWKRKQISRFGRNDKFSGTVRRENDPWETNSLGRPRRSVGEPIAVSWGTIVLVRGWVDSVLLVLHDPCLPEDP